MNRQVFFLSVLLITIFSCKKDNIDKEQKTYYDTGELNTIGSIDKDSLLTGLQLVYYKSGNIKSEGSFLKGLFDGEVRKYYENGKLKYKAFYDGGVVSGKVYEYYENGNIGYLATYKAGVKTGKETIYHENGVVKEVVVYENDKLIGDLIAYDVNSDFDFYIRFNSLGSPAYRLDIDSTGKVKESDWKFHTITNIDKLKIIKLNDFIELDTQLANPPSCKKILITKLNGVTKDSTEIKGLEYKYKVLPTDLGNNKLELFLDYYCTDYELNSDYFALDFNVE